MNIKGFTLVELMATMILIGLIGIISIPAINRTLNKQRVKGFNTTVKGMVASVKNDAETDRFRIPRSYVYADGKLKLVEVRGVSKDEDLEVEGKLIDGTGSIKYNSDGDLYIAIKNKKYCAKKEYLGQLYFGIIKDSKCYINDIEVDLNKE